MIDLYKKYYLDEKKVQQILRDGIVVFDTSALLDLYYYSETTQNEIFENVFHYLEKRLWIPSQVYFEYLKNKQTIANKPIAAYRKLISRTNKKDDGGQIESITEKAESLLNQKIKEIRNQLKTLKEQTLDGKKHPYLDPSVYTKFEQDIGQFEKETETFIANTAKFKLLFTNEIDKRIAEIDANIKIDNVHDVIQRCFSVGKEYAYEQLFEIAKEGKYRYEEQIPPGYMDEENKLGLQKYGDLFVWKQLLDYAKKQQKDFILVTNDAKNDWFEEDKTTPRFELLKEFNSQSQKTIWLLSMKNFLWRINGLLDEQLTTQIFEDVAAVDETRDNPTSQLTISQEMLQDVFDNVLDEQVLLIDSISTDNSIRLFNSPHLFEAENEKGTKYRVIATLITGGVYARTLHGMTNAFEIKKFYTLNNEHYQYINLIICANSGISERCLEHLSKNKVKKMFHDHSVRTLIGYVDVDRINIIKTNYSFG